MAIEKVKSNILKHEGFIEPHTIILNSTIDIIPDNAALGIYLYLARKPDDWIIWEQDIMIRFNRGRDHVRKAMKLLKDIGLLNKESQRDERGHIIGWITTLYAQVTENTSCGSIHITEIPTSGKTHLLDNPTHTKERYIQKKDIKQKKEDLGPQNTELAVIRKQNPLAAFLPDKYLLMQKQLTSECLEDPKAFQLFESKFGKLEVTFEEMLYECVMYYALKPEAQNVSKHRFIGWIKREKIEVYDKKPDSIAHKLYRDLTDEEKTLVSDYMHFKKYPELKNKMTESHKKKAQDLVELLKSTQNLRSL